MTSHGDAQAPSRVTQGQANSAQPAGKGDYSLAHAPFDLPLRALAWMAPTALAFAVRVPNG